jgi:hypothetical protein
MKENTININGTDYCYKINPVKQTLAIHDPIMAIVNLNKPDDIRIYQHNGDEGKARRDIQDLMRSINLVSAQ